MLGIVKKWFGPKANPIGVDFGTDSLKIAQVALIGNDWRLVAAASADIPTHVRHEPLARMSFLSQTTRDLLAQGNFSGRNAVLALPAASMFFQHLRLPKMDDQALKRALPWEARGKIPIDPNHALLRHHVAGTIYQDQEEKLEVIAMAASRDIVNQYLDVAAKAKLEIVNLNVEPSAIVDCFIHIYLRKSDADVTNCFVDIGCTGTRAIIARGPHILFVRSIPIGGNHLTQAVATALNLKFYDAKMLRLRLCALQPSPSDVQRKQEILPPAQEQAAEEFAALSAALSAAKHADAHPVDRRASTLLPEPPANTQPSEPNHQAALAEQACREPLAKIVAELDLCRRYHESTFPSRPVDRLIFIGGEAKHKNLCQYVARELGLAAQVGDPLVRMGRISDISIDSGIDRRQPQPNWAVAIGLSLGPNKAAAKTAESP
ncbi:MAG: pilus assembly protein PilM [Planctomycetota bacterium]|nr:pilus assembly protein PilM [Planctomycetota bacterium]